MNRSARIDALVSDAVEQGVAPGVVAAAVTADDVVYQGAFGRLGLSGDAPIQPDTIFWIASMTKALTSVAAMQLVEGGALSLDQPIGAIVPELYRPQILKGFDADGAPRLRPAARAITLRHLLTHTSGFAEDAWHPDIGAYMRHAGIPPGNTRRRATLDLPLLFEPGTRWQYGISHEWAGQAVERASGKPLDRSMNESLFGPLGMADTGWDLRECQKPRQAEVHQRGAAGQLTPIVREIPAGREFIPGGGSLHSTAGDYLAFIKMILGGGRVDGAQLIGADTLALMGQNHTGAIAVGELVPTVPALANRVEFMAGVSRCWGLGFQVNLEPLPTGRSTGSLAWAGLGNTYFWIDPARGIGGVLLTQILPFADPAVLQLFARFETAIYDAIGKRGQ
ncbi:MAG: serine hydrolase domain-containing protein [Geminicoccaceae bacterium]